MAEKTLAPARLNPKAGSEDWAKVHREKIQEFVRARASNASSLMAEIEKVRPERAEGAKAGGRMGKVDPRTKKPYAHILLGFQSWSDFVRAPQPEGLGWSPEHERMMSLGWRKAKEAGITPQLVDDLGQAWLAGVGRNKGGAADSLSLESAQAEAAEKKERKANPKPKAKPKRIETDAEDDDDGEGLPEKKPTSSEPKKPRPTPTTSGVKTPKAKIDEFLADCVPGIDAKSALRVIEGVLPHLDAADLVLVADEVVPKLESDHVVPILEKMVPLLDADETWMLARSVTRRLETPELEKLAEEVKELLAARLERDAADDLRRDQAAEEAKKAAEAKAEAEAEKQAEAKPKKGGKKK